MNPTWLTLENVLEMIMKNKSLIEEDEANEGKNTSREVIKILQECLKHVDKKMLLFEKKRMNGSVIKYQRIAQNRVRKENRNNNLYDRKRKRNFWTKDGKPICRKCEKEGHYTRECSKE